MSEEEKIKYSNIIYRLRIINRKLSSLDQSVYLLGNNVGKNILINDTKFKKRDFTNLNTEIKNISSNIQNNIISSLNNKINS